MRRFWFLLVLVLGFVGCYVSQQKAIPNPLYLIMTPEERAEYSEIPYPKWRVAWLYQFWRVRDFDPSTPENDGLQLFKKRLAYAYYLSAQEGRKGLSTDRARIAFFLGLPDRIEHIYSQLDWQTTLPHMNPWIGGRVKPPSIFREAELWFYYDLRMVLCFVQKTDLAPFQLHDPPPFLLEAMGRNPLFHKIHRLKATWKKNKLVLIIPLADFWVVDKTLRIRLIFMRSDPPIARVFDLRIKIVKSIKKITLRFTTKVEAPWVFVVVYDKESGIFRTIKVEHK